MSHTERSLGYYYQHIDIKRFSVAREKAGLTKKNLAEIIEKSSSFVSQLEAGKTSFSIDTFQKIVDALGVHPAYLTDRLPEAASIDLGKCHFRANRKISQSDRLKATRHAEDILRIYNALERRGVVFPEVEFPKFEDEIPTERELEQFADNVRKKLGLGQGPIHNMAEFLESIGIRIILLPVDCPKLDAFAFWFEDIPCIVIDGNSKASRMQFDYGHEFKHILTDENVTPGDLLVERAANRFASAFLMPAGTFSLDCPKRYRTNAMTNLKQFWHVSIGAALYRARELGILPERHYKNAIIYMARQGIKTDEPGEFERPLPTMLGQALELIIDDISLNDLADELGFFPDQLIALLKTQKISDKIINKLLCQGPQKAKLRLVK